MIKIEIFIGKDQLWHWHLKAGNGEIVCWSEGYNSYENAIKSADWMKINGPKAPINRI